MQELHLKHPDAKPKYDDLLFQGPIKFLSPVIYDTINEDTIAKAAIITKGAAGMSSLNADDWKRIIGSNLFGNASSDLRKAIAKMTKKLCGEELNDPDSIEALLAGRLIPLSKNPGVRPIGIGEVLRRIIGKVNSTQRHTCNIGKSATLRRPKIWMRNCHSCCCRSFRRRQ